MYQTSNRRELQHVIHTIEYTFEDLTPLERSLVQPHYETLHRHCYGDEALDLELVQRELQYLWSQLSDAAREVADVNYECALADLIDWQRMAGLETGVQA